MEFTADEQQQLLNVCKELGTKPKFDTKEDFVSWMREYVTSNPIGEAASRVKQEESSHTLKKELLPRIPVFSGCLVKSDHVPFEVWYYELECLVKQKRYSESAILNAARLSLRGDASKVAVRLGTEVSVNELMRKMKNLFGNIESGEELLAKFYSASQTDEESVVAWSCRLEDLMDFAVQAGYFARDTYKETLRSKFWNGLKHPLRELCSHKFDQINDYESLLVEVRKIESSLPKDSSKPKTSARVNTQQTAADVTPPVNNASKKPELPDYNAILQKMQAQISEMAVQLNNLSSTTTLQSSRPIPTCWRCGMQGHTQRVCRNTHLPLNGFRPAVRGNRWQPNPSPQ